MNTKILLLFVVALNIVFSLFAIVQWYEIIIAKYPIYFSHAFLLALSASIATTFFWYLILDSWKEEDKP